MNLKSLSFVVLVRIILGTVSAEGAPIRYAADWVAGTFAFGDPAGLAGAHVHVEAIVDPATLTPTVGPGYTSWRSSDGGFASVVQITISGSAHADGTSSGFSVGWDFYDDSGYSSGAFQVDPPADLVLEGPIEVSPGGYDMTIGQLVLALPASFNSPAPDGTLFPFPFENSELVAQAPVYMRYETVPEDGGSYAYGYNVSARAESVPEPVGWILALFGAIGLLVSATCRRRYACNTRSALRNAQRTLLRHAASPMHAVFIALLVVNVGPASAANTWTAGELVTYLH